MNFDKFPYSNFHELNLDWLISEIKKLIEADKEIIQSIQNTNNKITVIENKINDIESQIKDLNVEEVVSEELQKLIDDGTLHDIIEQIITEQINENLEPIKVITNPVVLIIGDSYSAGGGGLTESQTGMYNVRNGLVNLGYTVKYVARGGYGFSPVNPANTFQSLLETALGSMSTEEKNRCCWVIVQTGYNEKQATADSLVTSIGNFSNTVRSNLKNVRKMDLVVAGWTTIRNDANSLLTVYPLLKSRGETYRFSVHYSFMTLISNTLFLSDSVHPTVTGHQKLYYRIWNDIMGGHAEKGSELASVDFIPNTSANYISSVTMSATLDENIVFNLGSLVCNFNPENFNYKFDLVTETTVGAFNNNMAAGLLNDYYVPCEFLVQMNDNKFYKASGYLHIIDAAVKISAFCINNWGGTGYLQGQVKNITVKQKISIPISLF